MGNLSRTHEALLQLDAIPTPTAAAARLLELALEDPPSAERFAELIETDPGVAAELMRDANDPGRAKAPHLDLRAAVTAASADELRRLAFAAITPESAASGLVDEEASGMHGLRRHAVAVAVAARELALQRDDAGPDEAYGAGLMSAVGAMALASLRPVQAGMLRRRLLGSRQDSLCEQERQAFGFDNDQMARALGEAWDLPVEMRDVLQFQCSSADAVEHECPLATQELVRIVRAAREVAAAAGFAAHDFEQRDPPPGDVVELLAAVDREALATRVRDAVDAADALARPRDAEPETRIRNLRIANNELVRLLVRSEHQWQAADAVTSVMRYVLQRLGDGDPLPGLMFRTMESMGFKRVTFVDCDTQARRLTVKLSGALRGSTKVPEGSFMPLPAEGRGLSGPAILTRDDRSPEAAALLDLLGVHACVLAPLSDAEGSTRGFLAADHGPNGSLPLPGDERCLSIIADQASLLLRYERMSREQARMATVDPLTGAATRRRLMDRLDHLISLSGRTRIPLSLAILDLDHFKKFNDTMGHQVGDRLLQELVGVLTEHVRKTDLVGRYGGEEFVVLFPGADLAGAHVVAESLRHEIFEFGRAHAAAYDHLPISVSVGVAQLRVGEHGDVLEDAQALIRRADEVLYQAKHNGRNRVERAA